MTRVDEAALLIDFGSTYTKVRAVDLGAARILGSGQGPSTVASDVTVGLEAALHDLAALLGGLPVFRHRLASSSAAGGLRMVTVGLVRKLTAEAARRAALGAGAKVVGAFANELTRRDLEEIDALAPDILLLAGGTDGGNRAVIVHNAALLAESAIDCPVLVAGNRSAADEVADLLAAAGKTVVVADNVMPEFGELDIAPAREAIRRIFIERIVHAKGIDRAADMLDGVLMPTPAAVMDGAELLARGSGGAEGLGTVLVVDVGGATTDVHSICSGEPAKSGVVLHGLPEPYVKRTVEGDLGLRHNAHTIAETVGLEHIAARAGLQCEEVRQLLDAIRSDVERAPSTETEWALDRALAEAAVGVALRRHAGSLETVYTAVGPATMQVGKDLTEVECMIGTGGPLVHARDPAAILAAGLARPEEPMALLPRRPRLLLDKDYILYGVGLLATVDRNAAAALGLNHLRELEKEEAPA